MSLDTLITFVLGALVLAVALRLRTTIEDWWGRRQRRIGRRLQVAVLIDQGRKSRRRTCFWKTVFRARDRDLRYRTRVRYTRVADELRKHHNPAEALFSIHRTDVIIINWDAMNGDPVYGSDRTYSFLSHYRPDLLDWLGRGGVLIVESQGVSWGGAQEPYNCFTALFPDSTVTLHSGMWVLGQHAAVRSDAAAAGLARDLDTSTLSLQEGGLWERRSWFPRRRARFTRRLIGVGAESLAFIVRRQSHLYRGWFSAWSDDWTPVLAPCDSAGDADNAILLYRRVGSTEADHPTPACGAIVLSTMFIASSELYQLIGNLLKLSDHPLPHTAARAAGADRDEAPGESTQTLSRE